MEKLVMKFGGTSVANEERILHAANLIAEEAVGGKQVAVVVSAMGKTTDHLLSLANQIHPEPNAREIDMLLSTGEQVTASLLAMALQSKGMHAQSFTGWQAGIQTNRYHSEARIEQINSEGIDEFLNKGGIAVVTGFQGINDEGQITTLGRGGSDTSAVALAIAIGAGRCDIYTDVEGVYTTDPRIVKEAVMLHEISYDEMLELANLGAGILHPRAIEFAKNYDLPVRVRPAYTRGEGTIIKEEVEMESNSIVRGIAFEEEIVRLTITYKAPHEGSLTNIFTTLAEAHVNVDIIVQTILEEEQPSVSFTIKNDDFAKTMNVLKVNKERLAYIDLAFEVGLAKVSIVGSGMVSNPGVAASMFEALRQAHIPIKMVSTSEIKISVVVPSEQMVEAVKLLHRKFELEKAQ